MEALSYNVVYIRKTSLGNSSTSPCSNDCVAVVALLCFELVAVVFCDEICPSLIVVVVVVERRNDWQSITQIISSWPTDANPLLENDQHSWLLQQVSDCYEMKKMIIYQIYKINQKILTGDDFCADMKIFRQSKCNPRRLWIA